MKIQIKRNTNYVVKGEENLTKGLWQIKGKPVVVIVWKDFPKFYSIKEEYFDSISDETTYLNLDNTFISDVVCDKGEAEFIKISGSIIIEDL